MMARKKQATLDHVSAQTNGHIAAHFESHLNGHTNGQLDQHLNSHIKGQLSGLAKEVGNDHASTSDKTDVNRWRLLDERGRQTWHYLDQEDDLKSWPQSDADRYFLGIPMNLPILPSAKTPQQSIDNGLSFFAKLQLPPGNWACEYGGPMFLLPGVVCLWHVTNTPIPEPIRIEIKRYLFAHQNQEDGGWGLHIEGESTTYGTVMTYTILRLLSVDAEDERMIRARGLLHEFGGATNGPHWAKFWLSALGVMEWEGVNPIPPELWLLPDWTPISPWRWWIHMRMVFLPMSFIYSKRFVAPLTPLTRQIRSEIYTRSYDSINFPAHRNDISPRDNYHPKSLFLVILFWLIAKIWQPYLRPDWIMRRAEEWTFRLIEYEDANTDHADLAPVSSPMNALACYIHDGPTSPSFALHLDRLRNYLWMNQDGMMCNGTDGVQTWDTAWIIQAAVSANLQHSPKWHTLLQSALQFLDDQQIRADCIDQAKCYRQRRKGAWAFSTRKQGYTVSDTTSEAMKAVIMLQNTPGFPTLVSQRRLRDAIDTLLTMQNISGGFASYEPQRGGEWLENLNAAEVFGRIMVEYDYPECSTAVITALRLFSHYDPSYRRPEIDNAVTGALRYIRKAQRSDGSWYGSWGICFTYATMFACEALASVGETFDNSTSVRKACAFLVGKQRDDGGWGESYRSCETGVYCERESQVVMTAWALIALLAVDYNGREVLERGVRLIMRRQQANGEWLQEGIEGVFNKSVMISYPNYKFIFPIKALGMFAERYGDVTIL